MLTKSSFNLLRNQIVINSLKFSYKMNQKVLRTEEEESVELCSNLLKAGDVIALPTDTIYGLACSATNPTAIQKLYTIKGRNEKKPVAICVSEIEDVRHWAQADHLPDKLLHKLLPGPVTLVLHKSEYLDNPYLNPGVSKIGIRIPNFNFIREICKHFKVPVALTSANKSAEKSTLNIEEFKHLWPLLGGVFDGGCLGCNESQRAGSTVIDLSDQGFCHVIRRGIAFDQVSPILKDFNIEIKD